MLFLVALLALASSLELQLLEFNDEWLASKGIRKYGNNTTHYGDPKTGCMKDEQAVQVQGLKGDFCSPPCTGLLKRNCPTDVPSGVTATPECALQDASTKDKYCALTCKPTESGQCGTGTCQRVELGIGLCTYPSA